MKKIWLAGLASLALLATPARAQEYLSSTYNALKLNGATTGTVTVAPPGAVSNYTFTLPTGSGTAGQPLVSGGSGVPMTWGSALGSMAAQSADSVAITGGTVASANVSGAAVTATGGTTARSLADWHGAWLSTPDCGATTGGTNTAAINTCSAAIAAAGGGILRIPGGYAGTFNFTAPDPSVLWEFDGPNVNRNVVGFGNATDSGKVFAGVLGTTRPSGNNRAGVSDFFVSVGSGANGANDGDFVHAFHERKLNWDCSTARQVAGQCSDVALQGEDDVISLTLFQGGPDATASPALKSAGGLIVGSATCMGGVGWCGQSEMQTFTFDPTTLAVNQGIDIQTGVINSRVGEQGGWGVVYGSLNGTQTNAILVQGSASSRWTNAFTNVYNGVTTANIADTGEITFSNGLYSTNVATWTNGAFYNVGDVVRASGHVYRLMTVTSATGIAATTQPTHTSGMVTGADGLPWLYLSDSAGQIVTASAGRATFTETPYFRSAQPTPQDVPVIALQGDPSGQINSGIGGIALRTDGDASKALYLKTTSSGSSGWMPVVTASVTNAATAAGTTQASAYAITTQTTAFATVASGTGAVLPFAYRGQMYVINAGANALALYPSSGGQINTKGTNNALSVAAGSMAVCTYAANTQEYCAVSVMP